MANNNANQKKFKQKMADQGKKEIRGAYAMKSDHDDLKRIIRMFHKHRIQIMLFVNSLENYE